MSYATMADLVIILLRTISILCFKCRVLRMSYEPHSTTMMSPPPLPVSPSFPNNCRNRWRIVVMRARDLPIRDSAYQCPLFCSPHQAVTTVLYSTHRMVIASPPFPVCSMRHIFGTCFRVHAIAAGVSCFRIVPTISLPR